MPHQSLCGVYQESPFKFIPITNSLLEESIRVLQASFYANENVCVAFGLPEHPECFPDMDAVVRKTAKDGISIAAVDKATGKVTGVAFNKLRSDSEFYLKYSTLCTHEIPKKVLRWMSDVENALDIFEYCKVSSEVEIAFVGILPEFRKRGIAKKLFQESINLARGLNSAVKLENRATDGLLEITRPPEVITAICTSLATQKIAKDLKFTEAKRIDFNDFVYDGLPLGSNISGTPSFTIEYLRL